MRVAFALNTLGFLRHFESAVAELLNRGHEVRLLVTDKGEGGRVPETLRDRKGLDVFDASIIRKGPLAQPLRIVRSTRDYLRYHEPIFASNDLLRSRALERLSEVVSGGSRPFDPEWSKWCTNLTDVERARLRETFDALEEALPTDDQFDRMLLAHRPDVLLVTPLVTFSSVLPEWVKSARRLAVPVGFPVFSWDNLSTKGVIHEQPDRVLVWNDIQKREAIEMHAVAEDRVVVTGAPRFDEFFEMKPSESLESFCRRLGFDAAQPILTYLGSSPMVSPEEPRFVDSWIRSVRTSPHQRLRDANILIRPHPRCEDQWFTWRTHEPRVGVYVTSGLSSDQVLYDCLFYAIAVVGLNTSAQLEAGIVGRPVLTLVTPEYAPGQTGTLHFEYLLASRGGFVEVAESMNEHLDQLAAASTGAFDASRTARFIESFLRPAGLARPAAPILADAVESLAALSVPQPSAGFLSRAVTRLRARFEKAPQDTQLELRQARERAETLKGKTRQLRSQLKSHIPPEAQSDSLHQLRLDYRPGDLRIVSASDAERKWARACEREPWTVEWIEQSVVPGDVVYDIGASVGAYTLIAAERLQGRGLVVAVEPAAASYARLCENIVLNGFDALVVPIPLALGSASGLRPFTYRDRQPGQTGHAFADAAWQPGVKHGRGYTQPIVSATVDELTTRFGVPPPVHVKIDVDGATAPVLTGGRATFSSLGLRTLLIDLDRRNEGRVVALLESYGFELRSRHDRTGGAWAGLFARVKAEGTVA